MNTEWCLIVISYKQSGHGAPTNADLRRKAAEKFPHAQVKLRMIFLQVMEHQPEAFPFQLCINAFRIIVQRLVTHTGNIAADFVAFQHETVVAFVKFPFDVSAVFLELSRSVSER